MSASWSTRLTAAAEHFEWRLSVVDIELSREPAPTVSATLAAFLRAEADNIAAIENLPEVDGNDDGDVRDALGETLIALVEAIEAATR